MKDWRGVRLDDGREGWLPTIKLKKYRDMDIYSLVELDQHVFAALNGSDSFLFFRWSDDNTHIGIHMDTHSIYHCFI